MKKFKKCFSALFLSCFLAFGNISGCYLEVQAFEWVVPSLSVGESLLWLMGLLGMTYSGGATAWRDVAPEYEQDFIDYANEHGLTYTETSSWLNDTAQGKLNQLSDVWSSFKEWLKGLGSSTVVGEPFKPQSILQSYSQSLGIEFGGITYSSNAYADLDFYFGFGNSTYVMLFDVMPDSITKQSNGTYALNFPPCHSLTFDLLSNNVWSSKTLTNQSSGYGRYLTSGLYIFSNGYDLLDLVYNDVVVGDNAWEGATYNPALIPDINFADANTEDASIPGVIDLPWGNLGEDEDERDKTYDDLVGGLDLGQEIGDLWQALQDLMGVLAVDDEGVLQPNGGGENPPTLEDEVEENKVNGAFVLSGLQKVFPFCIPFDLYAFMTLLVAEPVAPVINWPIYNPITDSNEIITIDFSTWESVVILLRYIFDFLFIVGLLLMARALIGGGDSA